MSNKIWFDPTYDKWVLSDGEHYLEVPHWARVIIADEFERETEPLKTENARLRERLDEAHMSRLLTENENETLRELVQDVMPIVCNGCHERLCEMPKEEHPFVTCSFADRMRELGIEVDG